jgi:prolyl-tRNA synthetase
MFKKALAKRDELTSEATTYDEFKHIMAEKRGFIKAFWCEDAQCEAKIKEETKATTRCLPFIDEEGNVAEESGTCVYCGKPATHRWLFAQAY